MILVDSNVFLIDLRYPRDLNAATNKQFLQTLKSRGDGVTSIFNLLEIAGVLSFNLNEEQLRNLYDLFPSRYGVGVVPNSELASPLPRCSAGELFQRISRRLSLGDAQMLEQAENPVYRIDTIVSWDAPHFQSRTHLRLLTPAQFLNPTS